LPASERTARLGWPLIVSRLFVCLFETKSALLRYLLDVCLVRCLFDRAACLLIVHAA
jgi:hypothetical protein